MIMVEVKRDETESSSGALRRFSKRVQIAGFLRRVKGLRFRQRSLSDYKKQRSALVRLERQAKYERLKKLGKLPTPTFSRRAPKRS